jgi:hemerythrin-like domain-containing protein
VKRGEGLQALSRQHHQGLSVALRLKRVTSETADGARRAFLEFWASEGRVHFRAEEEDLLPAFAAYAGPEHEAIVRVLVEHVDMRRRASELAGGDDLASADLRELGLRLERHIRHEERVLFPLIEEALPAAQLNRLAATMEKIEGEG